MKLFVTCWSVIIFFTYYLTSAEGKKEYQLNFCFPKVHVLLLTKIVKVRRKRERVTESGQVKVGKIVINIKRFNFILVNQEYIDRVWLKTPLKNIK